MTHVMDPLFPIAHHLDEFQRMVHKSFAEFFLREVPTDRVRAADATGGFDAALWSAFTSLGGQTASLPEEVGGAGGSLTDAVLIGMECGRRLAPIPYAGSVSAVRMLSREGSGPFAIDALRGVVDARFHIAARGGVIALHGAAPEILLVRDEVLEVYEQSNRTLQISPIDNLGELPLAEIHWRAARPDHSLPIAESGVARWLCEHRVLAAAVLVGAGQQALSLCVRHVIQRRQFGRAIGSFQAVQHRLADRLTDLASAQLLVIKSMDAPHRTDTERRADSAVALAAAIKAAESAAKEALQLFGGYGYTLEYDIHLYLRFIKAYGIVVSDDDLAEDSLAARVTTADVHR